MRAKTPTLFLETSGAVRELINLALDYIGYPKNWQLLIILPLNEVKCIGR